MSSDQSSRLREERQVADDNALRLSPDAFSRWENCKSAHRFMAFSGKQLVLYKLMFLTPQIIDTLTCKDLSVTLAGGLLSVWESSTSKQRFTVGSQPVEVGSGCFLWMLKYSSLELSEHKGSKSLKFSIAYRTALNPEVKVDGIQYLLEKAVFDHTEF
jgi:hypothetical protein